MESHPDFPFGPITDIDDRREILQLSVQNYLSWSIVNKNLLKTIIFPFIYIEKSKIDPHKIQIMQYTPYNTGE